MAGCLLLDARGVCFRPGLFLLQLGEITHNGFVVKDICHLWLPFRRTVCTKYQTYPAQLALTSINVSRFFFYYSVESLTASTITAWWMFCTPATRKTLVARGNLAFVTRAFIMSIYAFERKVEEYWKNWCLLTVNCLCEWRIFNQADHTVLWWNQSGFEKSIFWYFTFVSSVSGNKIFWTEFEKLCKKN